MIKLSSYHTHTEFCDGRSTMEESILAAIEAGCPEIGFSTHSPLVGQNDWTILATRESEYLDKLEKLKKTYEKQIKVYKGIEFDILSSVDTGKYDYVIGSVHNVVIDGTLYAVDHTTDIVRTVVNSCFDGDPYAYCESYFESVSQLYERTKCDVIGHFDLITKFIEIDPLFDLCHPRYRRAVERAFNTLAQTPAVFEVNTGAIHRGYRTTPYPDTYVLDMLRALDKPVVITSDSHSADTVTFGLEKWGEQMAARGLRVITSMPELLAESRKS